MLPINQMHLEIPSGEFRAGRIQLPRTVIAPDPRHKLHLICAGWRRAITRFAHNGLARDLVDISEAHERRDRVVREGLF